MSKHDQRPNKSLMTCMRCQAGDCRNCVDILRMVYTDDPICKCTRMNHSGDPSAQQVADPFTGIVHAPGATIDPDGHVRIDSEFTKNWKAQFDE